MENITTIIKGCINKDHKCQKILYEHYRGYALNISFRYLYRYEKAVDAVNDGFVKLFNHFPEFNIGADTDNEKILMAWLKKIMINTSIDALRRSSMMPEIGGIPEYVWDTPDDSNKADQVLLYNDLIAMVKNLQPNYRTVFNLYVIDGYSHTEIAEILNISVGTSKSSLSRARNLLQSGIKKMEDATACRM
ncbi:RNA polymerase sigma factor [Panacibacter ginsenosidivorans]|uniref:RNA polymerase sigma factor n=1 Tax=Panacibacter ginsenosidivorans TaxID=1813871 RepID=A0A5B8VD52_9BACT|nr:RNA polymerase sigma factor [Panacibacter ginsenosidivorans]QEC68891.1 RNA polymerase sigma factor [Panacibacter ginsenosidivorans]